jgi:hypothetical protein
MTKKSQKIDHEERENEQEFVVVYICFVINVVYISSEKKSCACALQFMRTFLNVSKISLNLIFFRKIRIVKNLCLIHLHFHQNAKNYFYFLSLLLCANLCGLFFIVNKNQERYFLQTFLKQHFKVFFFKLDKSNF